MASEPQINTASTHSSEVVRGTHEFHIVGATRRKPFVGVASSSIKSAAFHAGGHTWQLVCRFDEKGQFESISLELLGTHIAKDVVAVANLRVDDRLGEWPPGGCPSDGAYVFSKTTGSGRSCKLWEAEAPSKELLEHGHKSRCAGDDPLIVHCAVDVLQDHEYPPTAVVTRKCFVSVVPPPTISQDLSKLLFVDESESDMRPCCMQPDVTFLVEQTEIQAHKLMLAMRSSVFAAEFRWHTSSTRLTVDDMTPSTFRAMLRFIYTDELPMKQSNDDTSRSSYKTKYGETRCEAMALDLLVAADRYNLERLRLMCENILTETMNTATVMTTLLLVQGRYSCRQLEDSCIEFIASNPDVYAVVMKTKEYQELKNSCSPLIIEIIERVAIRNVSRNSSRGSHQPPKKSWSTYNASEVVHGAHEFRIPNFRAVQMRHGIGKEVSSGTFQVSGYNWTITVYASGCQGAEGYVSMYLALWTKPPAHGLKVSSTFKILDPIRKSLMTVDDEDEEQDIFAKERDSWGYINFITMESVTKYLGHDGSFTIYCQVSITNEPYTSRSMPTTSAMITMPESSIPMDLEQLFVSEQGSDVSFLVEGSIIRAHSLVIAARSPILYKAVSASLSNDDAHLIQIDDMKAATFKSILHFIYTDKIAILDSMVVPRDMFGAACRFENERMKAMSENLLVEHISKDNVLDTLKVARHHHCMKLEDYCMEFILSLPPQLAKDVMKKMNLDKLVLCF